jgi:hypothetical protein
MRTWCFPCLLAFGLLVPRPCLAQAAADDPRADQEMQEDVEVLRRIVTESVQQVYQQADERVTRSCAACHTVASAVDFTGERNFESRSHGGSHIFWELPYVEAAHAHGWARPQDKKPSDHARVSGLANYVPGHGIVVQMEAPAPVVDRDVKRFVEADEAAPKRWDVLLGEMRGDAEKNPPLRPLVLPPQHRRVHRLILTEKVVELLAENGRNLRRLTPDEHVTIAFTFRTPSKEQRDAERATLLRHYFPNEGPPAMGTGMGPSGFGAGAGGGGFGAGAGGAGGGAGAGGFGPGGAGPGGMGPGGAGAPGPKSASGGSSRGGAGSGGAASAPPGGSSSAQTSAMAGDLLLRQERYAEAIAAYEKALKDMGVKLREPKASLSAYEAEMVRKLIQAYVGGENSWHAYGLLQWLDSVQAPKGDAAEALRRIYLDLTGLPPTPEEVKAYTMDTRHNRRELLVDRLLGETQDDGPFRVPARMTISCTRKQLDEVAGGKLTKLDFASKVSLKHYKASAPAAGKKDGPVKR